MSEGEGIMFGRNGKISKRQIRRILILEQAAKIGLLLPLPAQIPEGGFSVWSWILTAALTFPLGSAVGARLCGRDAGRVRRAGAASRRGMNPPEGQIHDNHGKDSMQARPSRAFRMSGTAPWNEHVMADTKYNRNDTSDACSKLCVPRRLRGDFLFFVTGMIHIQ